MYAVRNKLRVSFMNVVIVEVYVSMSPTYNIIHQNFIVELRLVNKKLNVHNVYLFNI